MSTTVLKWIQGLALREIMFIFIQVVGVVLFLERKKNGLL